MDGEDEVVTEVFGEDIDELSALMLRKDFSFALTVSAERVLREDGFLVAVLTGRTGGFDFRVEGRDAVVVELSGGCDRGHSVTLSL